MSKGGNSGEICGKCVSTFHTDPGAAKKIHVGLTPSSHRGEGGGHSTDVWVGMCGSGAQTLTLFKTEISDFPTLFTDSV